MTRNFLLLELHLCNVVFSAIRNFMWSKYDFLTWENGQMLVYQYVVWKLLVKESLGQVQVDPQAEHETILIFQPIFAVLHNTSTYFQEGQPVLLNNID